MFGSKDYVITNWHVIRGTENITVKFLTGEKINAKILLKDPQNDIVFLKLERLPELPRPWWVGGKGKWERKAYAHLDETIKLFLEYANELKP